MKFITISKITITEIIRERFWILSLVVAVALLLSIPFISATNEKDTLKAVVVFIFSVISFISFLLSIIFSIILIRRDYEKKISMSLFSKPMSSVSYILGRLFGILSIIFVNMIFLSLIGMIGLLLSRHEIPKMKQTIAPDKWYKTMDEKTYIDRSNYFLRGNAGNSVIYKIDNSFEDAFVLLKARVQSSEIGVSSTRIIVSAKNKSDKKWRLLKLSENSPYGKTGAFGAIANKNEAIIRNKSIKRNNLNEDYCSFVLPKMSGEIFIKITRLDNKTGLLLNKKTSLLLSNSGGWFSISLFKALLILLIKCSILASFAFLLGILTNFGVSLLGSITLFIGTYSVTIIQDALRISKVGSSATKTLELLIVLLPDFSQFGNQMSLIGGQAISSNQIFESWFYYGIYTIIFVTFSILAMKRRLS